MATKCVPAAMQHGHRRRFKKRSSSHKIANRLAALKRARLQQQKIKTSSSSSPSSRDASPVPVYQTRPQILTPENRHILEEIFGRYNDEERHAAGVLSSLCKAGLVRKVPSSSSLSSSDAQEHKDVLALPTMRQTTHMLSSWQSGVAGSAPAADDGDDDAPMTPDLSFSTSPSARSSVSGGSPAPDSPILQYARLASPSGPPPPPYDAWRKSIALSDASPTPGPRCQSSPSYSAPRYSSHCANTTTQQTNPFAKFQDSYFKIPSSSSSSSVHDDAPTVRATGSDNGMPSPPQSPTGGSWSSKQSAAASTLPTPPQSFTSSMQSQPQPQHYQPHAHYARHQQYELPAPTSSTRRSTLPPLPPLHYQSYQNYQQQQQQTVQSHHAQHHASPRMAAKWSARKSPSVPKPHCNVKYETAELDFIMYERTTKNRPWEDVTQSFNAALPHLRQYADMDYMRVGGASSPSSSLPSAASPLAADMGSKATMDRYRARPERTTPGLQASYYRLRLALPLLDDAGKLVFDAATNKQVFTEVMVRDDKSRKKNRRLSSVSVAVAASASASTSASHPKPGEDSSVHLVLYFPERVTYYDYWFVSPEDKALARLRAYERNLQRAQRGLPPWHPGCDDPESGILLRNKD